MSRSWTERIRIYLHPERVVLVREAGWFRRRVTLALAVAVEAGGEQAWSGALAALQSQIERPEWQGARATVILSGHFARFRLAPWEDSLTEEERTALLLHQYGEIYGEVARGWQVTVADGGLGKPGLACAVDARLMQALRDVFFNTSATLVSVKPWLMTAFNRWRNRIDGRGAWLVLAEPSLLTVALLQQGEWRAVHSRPGADGGDPVLELLLAREALRLGVEATAFPLYYCSPEYPGHKPDLLEYTVTVLYGSGRHAPPANQSIETAWCA